MMEKNFIKLSESVFVDPAYKDGLSDLGLTTIDAIFSFKQAENLVKNNLAQYRSRLKFNINTPPATVFLKRYDNPPVPNQLRNWLTHRRHACMSFFDSLPAKELADAGINTPKTICFGWQWGFIFEKRSFIITEKISDAESLEKKIPDYFYPPVSTKKLKSKRDFILRLADFIKQFHETGYRHRDLYFSHIFYREDKEEFYLIDLARSFRPALLAERYRIKDISQLYYSAPGKYFSKTDRLRFYRRLTGHKKLTSMDKAFIQKVIKRAKKMYRHDINNARPCGFVG